jgi:hypothetical protein
MAGDDPIAKRKRVELEEKLASLDHEFKHWAALAKEREFEKHTSQIERVTAPLDKMRQRIGDELGRTRDANVLAESRRFEQQILAVHRIWEFFRGKLLLRRSDLFRNYLAFCDELAWACYGPVAAAAKPGVRAGAKGPPLVYLNGTSGPFVLPRDTPFEAEYVENEAINRREFVDLLKRLPVPVIGVPWFQVRHVPEALVVAHEAGHAVEDDLGLGNALHDGVAAALSKAGVDRTRASGWDAWLGEVFADFFGTLALGPAFVGSLADFLATGDAHVRADRRIAPHWGVHPPDYLRVQLALETLRRTGFARKANGLEGQWTATYGTTHAMSAFVPDVPVVINALLGMKLPQLGKKTLKQLVALGAERDREAEAQGQRIVREQLPAVADARVFAAACRYAYEADPTRYLAADRALQLVTSFATVIPRGARAGGAAAPADTASYDAEVAEAFERVLFKTPASG